MYVTYDEAPTPIRRFGPFAVAGHAIAFRKCRLLGIEQLLQQMFRQRRELRSGPQMSRDAVPDHSESKRLLPSRFTEACAAGPHKSVWSAGKYCLWNHGAVYRANSIRVTPESHEDDSIPQ